MNITNIKITRVITHDVVRAQQFNEQPPVLSENLIALDSKGKELIGKRIVDTLASGSHCVDVTVDEASVGSPFDHSSAMLDANDDDFIGHSKHLAEALSRAQTTGSIKAGAAIFIQGTCIANSQESRFLAIIKADSDQGFLKQMVDEEITLTYVNNMLLGHSQRLIKIAFFIEESVCEDVGEAPAATIRATEDFSIKVFDHMMQASGNGNAATYFYSTFLQCKLAENAPRQTKHFYDVARSFIDEMSIDQAEKVELRGDLISYLRGNRATLEPRTFAQEVLPEANQDTFVRACRESGITEAISKDLALLKGKLRRQSVKFSSNVTLYASPDIFREAVKITGVTDDGWTELKIRGEVETIP